MTRSVLVTGTSSGIGRAVVMRLAVDGFTVFAGVRNERDAHVASIDGVRPVTIDVTNCETIASTFRTIAESGVPLHALVNNAGIALGGPLEHLPLDDLRKQLEVNVIGTMAVTQAAIPMLRKTRGRIVSIGSIASRFGAPFLGPYCASKAALSMLMDSLRFELAPAGIAVVLFEFAAVKTPIWQKGRALKDDLSTRLPERAMHEYATFVDAAMKQIDREERVGLDPAIVAKAIVAALTVPHPRPRYVIGRQAHVQAIVAALPHRLRDGMVRNALGIP
ncbi:MAG: SDR family NAD(P)-dependent oxidoreductase [Candidatus Eremiobacteraeota bacterium]|nr:SDR family NAD(P)-dependent oxidoreductase [Candidatus Eremiobacteraeota bacterium]